MFANLLSNAAKAAGKGSEFTVRLPLAAAKPTEAADSQAVLNAA